MECFTGENFHDFYELLGENANILGVWLVMKTCAYVGTESKTVYSYTLIRTCFGRGNLHMQSCGNSLCKYSKSHGFTIYIPQNISNVRYCILHFAGMSSSPAECL